MAKQNGAFEIKEGKKTLDQGQKSLIEKLRDSGLLPAEQEDAFKSFLNFFKRTMPDRFRPENYNDEGPKLQILFAAYDASKGYGLHENAVVKENDHGHVVIAQQGIAFLPKINEEKSTETKTVYNKIDKNDIKEMARIAMLDERFLNGNYKVEGGTPFQRMALRRELNKLQKAMAPKPEVKENTAEDNVTATQSKSEPILTPEAQAGLNNLAKHIQTNVVLGAAFLKSAAQKAGSVIGGHAPSAKPSSPAPPQNDGAQPA